MQDPFANAGRGSRKPHVASLELAELARLRDDILLLAADLGRGPLGAAFIAAHPERFHDFGIAEANSLSVAAGLAACGFKPYVIAMSCFSAMKCAEQIRNDLAFPMMPVRILSSLPGLALAYFGTSHHAVEDIAIARSITNLTLVAPSDAQTTRALLRSTIDDPGPVYFRLMQGSEADLYPEPPAIERGRFLRLREGRHLTMIATGLGTQIAAGAAEMLARDGVEAAILDAVYLKPFDEAAVVAAARATGHILCIEEHGVIGGLGSAVAEVLARHALPVRILLHGLPDTDLEVSTPAELYELYGLTPQGVAAKARELVGAPAGEGHVHRG
ncbi:MAG: transketolase family protein [Hyphomicrobiales bacterium]